MTMVDNTAHFRASIKIMDGKSRGCEANRTEDNQPTAPVIRPKRTSQHYAIYSNHARQILTDITELRDLVLDKRKEYIMCSNAFSLYGAQRFMSDEDRKKFDNETDMVIRQCTKLIKDLEIQINSDQSLRTSDEQKHLLTVVNLLNIYLKEVLSIVAQLRAIHVRKTRQIRKICRLANLVDMYGTKLADVQREEEAREAQMSKMKLELERNERRQKKTIVKKEIATSENKENKLSPMLLPREEVAEMQPIDGWDDAAEIPELSEEEDPKTIGRVCDPGDVATGDGWSDAVLDLSLETVVEPPSHAKKSAPSTKRPRKIPIETENVEHPTVYEPTNKAEQTQLVAENRKIFDRFTTNDAELQRIESHVAEIQRLQNMFAEKISEQEQDIDIIHSRAVYTLDNLEQANDYIRNAIKNQANRRVIMIFCLLVLTFTLLFLDWYNP